MLAAQPEFLYVLGFATLDLKDDGSFHPLKISLRNPRGFRLQSRRGYYAPRHPKGGADELTAADTANNRAKRTVDFDLK